MAGGTGQPATMQQVHLRGILAMLFAVGFFAAMDAVLKVFAAVYPPLQVAALRAVASLPFVVAPVLLAGQWRALRPVNLKLHLLRGALGIVMLVGFVNAVSQLSLGDAYSVFFVAPVVVAALSGPWLGERVRWQQWLAIGTGLGGVLLMLQLGSMTAAPGAAPRIALAGAASALVAAVAYAVCAVLVRVMAPTETNAALVTWYLLIVTAGAGALALPGWVPLRPGDWGWLAAIGITGALGQLFITDAFRRAPAAVVAPFEYTALLWALLIDQLVWSVAPSLVILPGVALVVASGIYLMWRERGPGQAAASAAGQPH